jgi:hypothetical protein
MSHHHHRRQAIKSIIGKGVHVVGRRKKYTSNKQRNSFADFGTVTTG